MFCYQRAIVCGPAGEEGFFKYLRPDGGDAAAQVDSGAGGPERRSLLRPLSRTPEISASPEMMKLPPFQIASAHLCKNVQHAHVLACDH